MDKEHADFIFALQVGIKSIQEKKPDSTISLGFENDKWWCELSPEGYGTYSETGIFSALTKMDIWMSEN